jgi:hypothetical protein
MLRSLHFLQFSIGHLIGFNKKLRPQGEVIALSLIFQAFQFEHGIDSHKHRVVLRDHMRVGISPIPHWLSEPYEILRLATISGRSLLRVRHRSFNHCIPDSTSRC